MTENDNDRIHSLTLSRFLEGNASITGLWVSNIFEECKPELSHDALPNLTELCAPFKLAKRLLRPMTSGENDADIVRDTCTGKPRPIHSLTVDLYGVPTVRSVGGWIE